MVKPSCVNKFWLSVPAFPGMWAALSAALWPININIRPWISPSLRRNKAARASRFYESGTNAGCAAAATLFDATGVHFLRGTVSQLLPASKSRRLDGYQR